MCLLLSKASAIGVAPCGSFDLLDRAWQLLELQLGLGQHLFDFGLGLKCEGRAGGDEPHGFEEGEVFEQRESFIGEIDPAEFQVFQLRDAGDEFQIGIRESLGVGECQTAQGGDVFDEADPFRCVEAIAELQVFQLELGDLLEAARRGIAGADFQTFEFGELGQMDGSGIGELGVGETDAFEIRKVLAELSQTFIVDRTAAMADFDEPRPACELGIGVALHASADKGK